MTVDAVFQGFIARQIPSPQGFDGANNFADVRLDQRGNFYANSRVPTKHLLADEGIYFTANYGQSAGLATAAAPTAYSATNPFLVIANTASPAQPNSPRIAIDYITLLATAAGTGAASVQASIVIDNVARYSSGGVTLTPQKINSVGNGSVAQIYAGNITASAAGLQARIIVGNRYLKGAIPVAGDQYSLFAGSVDGPATLSASTITFSTQPIAPVIINPGETALLHLWFPSQSAASSYAPELGYWEY